MRANAMIVIGLLCLVAGCAVVTKVPAPPKGEYAMIDDCQYADDAAAQAAWEPMEGSPPVTVATLDGRKAARMVCKFEGTRIDRGCWDLKVKLDLIACQGIQFKFFCANTSPVSHFMVYLQSGDGWYSANFSPKSKSEWNTITIDKANTKHEGKPAGWGSISTIRISAWRGKDVDTELYVSDIGMLGVLGVDATVAIVRGESAAQHSAGEATSVDQFAQNVAKTLTGIGVTYAVISDLDVTAERLKAAKLAILPHNPNMPDNVADEIIKYANGGGKLLIFYGIPAKLRPVVKIEGGAHIQAKYPGYFSTIKFLDNALPGAPAMVGQKSWNISEAKPVPGASKEIAQWLDDKGQPTGYAALVASDNCLVMTHVLLPDDAMNKRRMMLAMVGHFVPELWQRAAEASVAKIGQIGDYKDLDSAAKGIIKEGKKDPKVVEKIGAARQLCEEATTLCSNCQYPEATNKATAAVERLTEAYCMAQQPLAGETRLFWCHSAYGVEGMTWDEAIKNLADNGFTGILPNMLWGGLAYCPSKVLPVAPDLAEKGDQIALCLAACKKYGIQMHVWKVNWNMSGRAPKDFVEKMRREGRVQVDVKGKEGGEDSFWLCPSHPENQKLEIDSMVEVARNYDVDGLHFDYIRYPGGSYCFCPGCKERFQTACGVEIKSWPGDVLKDEPYRQQWLDWRRSNITTVVKAVSEQARAIKPNIKISAAVFRNWPTDRDSVGQDWKLWCDEGYMDFLCPMDYTESDETFTNFIENQKTWAGKTPIYPGIGAASSGSHLIPVHVIAQIKITRRFKTGGFTIFNYDPAIAKDLVPLMGMGITSKR
jgi:uncharacterized lipoprotein YddW (UPF0748 family)